MPDYVNIRTAQNVEITYKLAGLGNRVLAKLIDIVIIIGYSIAIGIVISSLEISPWEFLIFGLPIMLYTLLFETFNNGQTPGKSITRTKVVSQDGAPLSISQILTRWLLQIIDIWLVSGLPGIISIGSGNTQQRLGDRSAGTLVISLKETTNLNQTAFTKIRNDYQPKYIQASQLDEKDITILKSVLNDKSDNQYSNMKLAADKIQNLLAIKKSASSKEFIITIIKDFNYYQQEMNNIENDSLY